MKDLYDISIGLKRYPEALFAYPCVDSNVPFLAGKNVTVFENQKNDLSEWLLEDLKDKGAVIHNAIHENIDILIINAPFLRIDKIEQTEKTYFDILFHYIKPAQKAIPFMAKKRQGQICFILPPKATIPSVEYSQMAAFASVGLVKGLALQYAPKGIVINGIVLGEKENYDSIAAWITFLSGGNARNIIGELIVLD
jgi:NAD(P)-dependent dehydrogenase (short-subunit alcohol dehydrogenase family)